LGRRRCKDAFTLLFSILRRAFGIVKILWISREVGLEEGNVAVAMMCSMPAAKVCVSGSDLSSLWWKVFRVILRLLSVRGAAFALLRA